LKGRRAWSICGDRQMPILCRSCGQRVSTVWEMKRGGTTYEDQRSVAFQKARGMSYVMAADLRSEWDTGIPRRGPRDGCAGGAPPATPWLHLACTPVVSDLVAALIAYSPSWQKDAACREHLEVSFFVERGEDSRPAKAICAGCLVREECAQYACDEGIAVGIWGGLSGLERRKLHARAA